MRWMPPIIPVRQKLLLLSQESVRLRLVRTRPLQRNLGRLVIGKVQS